MLSKVIFFFFALIAIVYEMWSIKNSKRLVELSEMIRKSTNDKKEVEPKPAYAVFIVCQALYCFWALVGLFSSQWVIFAILLLLGSLSFFGFTKTRVYIICDAIITLGLLVFMVINAFHLHIPLWSRLLDYFL